MKFKTRYVTVHRHYRVGSDGSVWSKLGRGNPLRPKWKRMHGKPNVVNGYVDASFRINGKSKYFKVSRLVLEAFVGPCPEGMEACHRNGIRHDNRWWNLYWGTHKQNAEDMRSHGNMFCDKGEKHGLAKITEKTVRWIRAQAAKGVPQKRIQASRKCNGLSQQQISAIVCRRKWQHVSDKEVWVTDKKGRWKPEKEVHNAA